MPTCCHVKEKLMTPTSFRTLNVQRSTAVYTQFDKPHTIMPVARVVPLSSTSPSYVYSSGAGHPCALLTLTYNLMYALTAELKLIGNLTQRLPARAKLHYQRVAICIRRWTRLKRSPLPTRNSLELLDSGLREKALLFALPHVTHPSAKTNFTIIDKFDMRGRHVNVTILCSKLIKCFFVNFKSCDVVHGNTIVELNYCK